MKIKQPDDKIVASLEALKAELIRKGNVLDLEMIFKINSCLYDQYPIKKVA